jgi:hypothetical protein
MLILDAYRYDLFSELSKEYNLPGELNSYESAGSATPEFLSANIDGVDLTDTVYVTATTMLYRELVMSNSIDTNIHKIIDVWADSIDHGEWGVSPESVTSEALDALEEYPNKRIVAHYIQPHLPFVGSFGQSVYDEIEDRDVWKAKQKGELKWSDQDLWKAYRENAELITEHIANVIDKFPGKTVVTSDHGQLIGERVWPIPVKHYSHPAGIWTDKLVKIPWLVYENGQRRKINKGGVSRYSPNRQSLDTKAEDHLRDLGYL